MLPANVISCVHHFIGFLRACVFQSSFVGFVASKLVFDIFDGFHFSLVGPQVFLVCFLRICRFFHVCL